MDRFDLFAGQRHRVDLVYGDYTGKATQRTVDVTAGYRDTETMLGYLQAWCLLREAWRTFRDDRCREWMVPGAPVPLHFSLLDELAHLTTIGAPQRGILPAQPARKPRGKSKQIEAALRVTAESEDELAAMIAVLTYMAWADGRVAKTEATAIGQLIDGWGRGWGVPNRVLDDIVREGIERDTYRESLDSLAKSSSLTRASVLAGAAAIASASAGIKEDEAVVLLEIGSALGAAAAAEGLG